MQGAIEISKRRTIVEVNEDRGFAMAYVEDSGKLVRTPVELEELRGHFRLELKEGAPFAVQMAFAQLTRGEEPWRRYG
jgi:hypothetical protein